MFYTFLRTLFLVTNHAFTKSETLYQKSDAMFSHILKCLDKGKSQSKMFEEQP